MPAPLVVSMSDDELLDLARRCRNQLRSFLIWAGECLDQGKPLRLRDRPDSANALSIAPLFESPWWAVVVYTCFDSVAGARRAAPLFAAPPRTDQIDRLLAALELQRGDIAGHRIQPGHRGAKTALGSACAVADEFQHILTDPALTFDERYTALLDLRAPQWSRTTCFDLTLRAGQLGIAGRVVEPEIAYLLGSQGPASGFQQLFDIAVTAKDAASCEGVLRGWIRRWADVSTICGVTWVHEPLTAGDLENALCIFQERHKPGWPARPDLPPTRKSRVAHELQFVREPAASPDTYSAEPHGCVPVGDLPDYVIEYLSAGPPPNVRTVVGSAPVVAFGNARTARVATLGFNPSLREFGIRTDGGFRFLDPKERRLATVASLGLETVEWPKGATPSAITGIVDACDAYFLTNPYGGWFDDLDLVLRAVGHTYYGTSADACHLDLSPWATDPTWGKLTIKERRVLLDNGRRLLRSQLAVGNLELILINGSGVARTAAKTFGAALIEAAYLRPAGRPTAATSRIWTATFDGVPVVAWSVNLQSSFGVTNDLRQLLRAQVRAIATERTAIARPSLPART